MTDNTKPVKVSPGAYAALSYKMRQWTGWPTGTLTLGETGTESNYAACWHGPKFEVVLNPDRLVLNPNRVINTVTPFRLRQEAVLTGALLHEAGHARHSHWQPGRYGNADKALHSDGTEVSDLVLEFAKTVEEARIEGLIAAESTEIGAHGLSWTMRCSSIAVLPFTDVSMDPAQAVLDVLGGWVLRAGRVLATAHHFTATGRAYSIPKWVGEYNKLLNQVVSEHIVANKLAASGGEASDGDPWGDDPSADPEITQVMTTLYEMLVEGEDASKPGSTFMVDRAREVLDILFPASQQENLTADSGCQEEQGDPEENDPEDGAGSDESDDQGEDEGESGSEGDEPGESDEDGDEDGDGSDESDSDEDGETQAEAEARQDNAAKQAKTQAAVDAVESEAAKQAAQEKAEEIAQPSEGPDPTQGQAPGESDAKPEENQAPQQGAGSYYGRGRRDLTYRQPVKDEREVKKGAETFLRNIIDPSEKGKLQVTDAPTASVDGAALSAWKAGGQNTAPLFFRRIKRTEQPAPPVKIAILVDVSASMDVLQKPSALLSWALSAACLDLRNFAGRGIQVESTLIHWGSDARVIQPNGQPMPGIHIDECMESTVAMHDALDLVEQQLPGFFDPKVKNENRLLVQFTDWLLGSYSLPDITRKIDKALTNGVNMLSVVPHDYSWRSTSLDPILASVARPKGRSALLKYNPNRPDEVWTAAAEILSGADSNYGF